MNFIRAALQRPYMVVVLALSLAIGGWVAIQRMARVDMELLDDELSVPVEAWGGWENPSDRPMAGSRSDVPFLRGPAPVARKERNSAKSLKF